MGTAILSKAWRNFTAYALLTLCLVGVHTVLAANPDAARSAAQAAVFQWKVLGIVCGLGLISVLFLNLTSLRGLWDGDLGFNAKATWPFVLGAVLGAADLGADLHTHFTRTMAAEMHLPSIHIAWPLSLPIYFGGAILVTIIYFFVLLPFLYWAIGVKWLKGRGEAAVFGVIGSLLALVEPLTQGDVQAIMQHGTAAVPSAVCDLLLNLGQVWLLRRSGLIAAALFRVGYYAVWHVIYGLI